MFEGCDRTVKLLVDAALEESRARNHTWLGTEHLLVAFARRRDLMPPEVADRLPAAESVSAVMDAATGRGRPDAELLKTVGIDLEAVRSAVVRTFGDDAVRRLRRPVHQPWQPWRRPSRRCTSLLAGEPTVTPRLKEALEQARRDADRRGRPEIDPVSLVLGMMAVEDAMSNRLLDDVGVDRAALRAAVVRHAG